MSTSTESKALERKSLELKNNLIAEYRENRREIIVLASLGESFNPGKLARLRARQSELFLTPAVQDAFLRGELV